jgi:hypothetical protein
MLVCAVGILLVAFIWHDVWLKYLFYVYPIPVIIVNIWEWTEPEIMETFFGKEKGEASNGNQKKP